MIKLISLNFPITYFVSNFTSVSNRIGPLCFGGTSNLQGLLRTFKCRYLSTEQANLFCFVLHVEISQITALHATLLVSSKNSWWVGVHQVGLRLFGAMVWKLVIIESFFQWKLNNIKNRNWKLYWNLGALLVFLESLWWVRFNSVYFTIFRAKAKAWKRLIFEWILLLEMRQIV